MTSTTKEKQLTECAVGDVVEGPVVAVDRSTVYIDLSPIGTGIIYGKEFIIAKDLLRKVHIGDVISAKIIDINTPEGYIDLSLKEARQALVWKEAEDAVKSGKIYEILVKNANRGGLVTEWNNIRGFLPASQLTEEHYPKVLNGDKESILTELKKLIGKKMSVAIESVDQETGTLIFAEKKSSQKDTQQSSGDEKEPMALYKVGDVKSGIVTGVVDFGVFVTIGNNVEGLVHISEMDWGLVDDPRRIYSVGDNVQVKILSMEDGKLSLSFKELLKNPWEDAHLRYKVGDVISGVVIKYNSFGVFASIEAGISGLIHVSNFESEEVMRNTLEIGKSYKFSIVSMESEKQKLVLAPHPPTKKAVSEKAVSEKAMSE